MALATIDLLARVIAALQSPDFGRLDALRVNNPSRWSRTATGLLPDFGAELVVDGFPSAVQPPQAEVMIDSLPLREILGQQIPADAAADQIKDGVQDLAHISGTRASAGFCFRNESLNMFVFTIGQVA